ncbi:histidine phosphatase superfamily, clade-1 [Pochonia chlamydosporia 170]|uniref:Histidine phosphatase superfamily, clade-1 n=1 Tax=Pochonia chlamydosporia 170 TaxID=1380566 RepID=A0A179FIU7_METCM|nr:histidine phosphatase superfamily, clade-1 [Pochonia chlamydosporia 170]OAQ64959.1 histidine phosphatase superfamily, clade-1 [Pochonia chlamydosporia 170]
MSDQDAATPRVFLVRHGETEWSKTGQYTGITDLPLTPDGVKQVTTTAVRLVGGGKLIDPARIAHIWVSPRTRAQQTFQYLFNSEPPSSDKTDFDAVADRVTTTEDIAEWDYGEYEGLKTGEIKEKRKQQGLDQDKPWNIWKDGCEGGESMEKVTERLDKLITQIKNLQRPFISGQKPCDVLIVAHGLILRAFAKRWMQYALDFPLPMIMAPGAISVLSYKNGNIDEPGFYLGMSLPFEE